MHVHPVCMHHVHIVYRSQVFSSACSGVEIQCTQYMQVHVHPTHAQRQYLHAHPLLRLCVCAESVLSLGVCENRDGWLVAWGFCG